MTLAAPTMDTAMACTTCGAMSLFDTDWQSHPEEPVVCPNCLAAIAFHLWETRGDRQFVITFRGETVVKASDIWPDHLLPVEFTAGDVWREINRDSWNWEPEVVEIDDAIETERA